MDRYLELDDDNRCAQDAAAATAHLALAVREPRFRRAVAVASPSLFEQLGRLPSGPSALRRRGQAVLRYLIRMSTRCTPYGLNAAVSLAWWGECTDLELGEDEVIRGRLDMGLLDALIGELEGRLDVVRMLRLRTQPLVSLRAGRAFLPERFSPQTGAFEVSVRATAPVARVLELCRRGPIPFIELSEVLGEECTHRASG